MAPIGADVRVVGVGGAGGNALKRMLLRGVHGATLIAANTDTQALLDHPAPVHVVLGRRATRGLGAGGRPEMGFAAAQESRADVLRVLEGADMVFIAAGLGGGTGTGAGPYVASVAREIGALVVGVVTLPFTFEGRRRQRAALQGLAALRDQVDSVIVVANDRLLEVGGGEPSVVEAFARADGVLSDGVRGVGELVTQTGLINLDFADVHTVLSDGGRAVMGVGVGRGPDRALRAVEAASSSPLLRDDRIEGARGVLLRFRMDPALGLAAIHRAVARVQAEIDDDAEILFGVTIDPTLVDEVELTLVAAGLSEFEDAPRAPSRQVPAELSMRPRNALVMLNASRTR